MVFAVPALAGAAVEMATSAISAVIKKYIPDPAAQAQMELDVYKTLQSTDLAQLDVNKAEAQSGSIFIAGWRPAIGWICAASLAWQFVVKGWAFTTISLFNEKAATAILNSPSLDNNVWELVFAMLGMGALRSFDKFKGVASK